MASAGSRAPSSTLRCLLAPDEMAREALLETFGDYQRMMELLGEIAPEGTGSNLVVLHELAYETLRARTRLPSRLVTLGLRDFAARRAGEAVAGLPLDEKLYAIKSPSVLTISTVQGRIAVPFDMAGYLDGWKGSLPARLVLDEDEFELRIGVTPHSHPGHPNLGHPPPDHRSEEKTMVHEGILSRMGRLIAGVAHATVDRAEAVNPVAVVEQAIREIDAAADEARTDLGKARAEEHRITSRRREIEDDIAGLDARIRAAVKEGRDDLAKVGVARQIDLEAQIAALDKALADVAERIDEGQKAMQAVVAAKHDAEARLAELKRSETRQAAGNGATGRRSDPLRDLERAAAAVARVTGVPGGLAAGGAELDELERLHREQAIAERLARFKSSG